MTIRNAHESPAAGQVPDEGAVVAFLAAHPELFERHPDLLAKLRIPHAAGGAISLIERQVAVLREQLEAERRRLAHFIARARNYETLAGRLHELVLKLIAAPNLVAMDQVLRETLCRELGIEAVTLKLFPKDSGASDAVSATFRDFLARDHALCGPLDGEHNSTLFGDLGPAIQSAALIPIVGTGHVGVLALGSTEADRFGPDLGTELLDRLGAVVSQKLKALSAGHG